MNVIKMQQEIIDIPVEKYRKLCREYRKIADNSITSEKEKLAKDIGEIYNCLKRIWNNAEDYNN